MLISNDVKSSCVFDGRPGGVRSQVSSMQTGVPPIPVSCKEPRAPVSRGYPSLTRTLSKISATNLTSKSRQSKLHKTTYANPVIHNYVSCIKLHFHCISPFRKAFHVLKGEANKKRTVCHIILSLMQIPFCVMLRD